VHFLVNRRGQPTVTIAGDGAMARALGRYYVRSTRGSKADQLVAAPNPIGRWRRAGHHGLRRRGQLCDAGPAVSEREKREGSRGSGSSPERSWRSRQGGRWSESMRTPATCGGDGDLDSPDWRRSGSFCLAWRKKATRWSSGGRRMRAGAVAGTSSSSGLGCVVIGEEEVASRFV
jgi:hypothetical protein